jgi:hypothetical protein
MLDPWIIEEIKRREDERRREQEGERLEIPLERPYYREAPVPPPTEESDRGVTIIDL